MRLTLWIRTCLLAAVLVPGWSHVVFEEIGSMAGSASYIHCTLNINLSAIEELIQTYNRTISTYRQKVDAAFVNFSGDAAYYDPVYQRRVLSRTQYDKLLQTFQGIVAQMYARLIDLRGILPGSSQGNPSRLESFARSRRSVPLLAARALGGLVRKGFSGVGGKLVRGGLPKFGKPSLLLSLAQGVFGTFMGLYTQKQISKLQQEILDARVEQDRLLEVVNQQQREIDEVQQKVTTLYETLEVHTKVNAPLAIAQLSDICMNVQRAFETVVHAIQQVHHRRLAIDFLSAEQLGALFDTIGQTAAARNYVLLIDAPSDLFQVEASYVSDEGNVVIVLHVPMVPQDSLLRLFRLRPFPIPFSSTMALLPETSSSLLALSQGSTRLMTTIEHSDLMDCHRIGSVFICERHSVLFNQIKATCLGSLFEQDISTAREICDLELVPYQEAVLQLQSNWFLIYSPSMFTGYVQCHNGTSNEAHIKRGVNRLFVDPSCTLNLRNHSLHSETSLRLDSEIKYFQWEAADMSTFDINDDDVDHAITVTGLTHGRMPLREVLRQSRFRLRLPSKTLIFVALAVAAAVALVVFVAVSVGTHRMVLFRQKFRALRAAIALLLERLHHAVPSVRNVTHQLRSQLSSGIRHQLRRLRPVPPPPSIPLYPNLAEAPDAVDENCRPVDRQPAAVRPPNDYE
jgi:hypothetical protein